MITGKRNHLFALAACLALAGIAALTFAGTAHAAGEFEPNDSRDTAYGPLGGGKNYVATFETENDDDWYVFYVREHSQVEFSGTVVKEGCPGSWRVELLDARGRWMADFNIGRLNEVDGMSRTMDAGRYYLKFSNRWRDCVGTRYRVRIDPAAALTESLDCGEAIVARDDAEPKLAAAIRQMRRNGRVTRTARRAVKRAQRRLRRARSGGSSWSIRSARSRLRTAKRARRKAIQQRKQLRSLRRQHGAALNEAQAQINLHC